MIKRVQELHDSGNALTKAQMEIIYPKLAKTEDERMTRVIGLALTDVPEERFTSLGTTLKDCLAHLDKMIVVSPDVWDNAITDAYENGKKDGEKQKEQKPADEQFPPLEGLDAIKAKYYDDGFKNGFDEGVESVKPAEWDDYTKTNLDRALQIIRDAKGTLQGYQSDDGIYECDKAIECIEHFLYRGLEIEKPSEWSEEDERVLKGIIGKIDHDQTYGVSKAEMLSFLKSLRPQPYWKPSDEQMRILRKYVMGEWRDLTIGQDKILTSLYTDLQKLL